MKLKTLVVALVILLLGMLAVWLTGRALIEDVSASRSFGTGVLIITVVLVGLLFLLFYRSLSELAETSKDLNEFAEHLAEGQYNERFIGAHHNRTALRGVTIRLNEMAEQLEATSAYMAEKTARLDAILNSMIDPLVMVDGDLWVQFMNTSAGRVFSRNLAPDANPFPLILLTGSETTETLAKQAYEQGQAEASNISILTSKGRRQFDIVAVPVRDSGESRHTILIFDDRTDEHKLQTMRQEFVANVTHELKSPLTSIRGFIETLRHTKPADDAVRERFMDIIEIEAERLEQLISDILVLSEIESARNERNLETFSLAEVAAEVLMLLEEKAADKTIDIDLRASDDVIVTANRNRLRQIFINLIDNAIKYSNEGGKIVVAFKRFNPERISITVADNGPGIEPEYQTRIFERFYRIDRGRSRSEGSTGLGLSIVKHIAQLYQGRAYVESEPGRGATFTVDLKL